MKNTDSYMKEAPEIDPTLLLKFLIRRYDEIIEGGSEKISVVSSRVIAMRGGP